MKKLTNREKARPHATTSRIMPASFVPPLHKIEIASYIVVNEFFQDCRAPLKDRRICYSKDVPSVVLLWTNK